MSLKVGAAHIEVTIERAQFRQAQREMLADLAELKAGGIDAAKAASQVASATKKILDQYSALKSALAGARPFDELTKNARAAYVEIVGNSVIPDLADKTIDVVAQLRQQLSAAKPFDGLAANAAKNADEIDRLAERAEALEATIESIGISRQQLRTVIDGEGRVRDSVTVRADRQDSGERGQQNQYRDNFGNVRRSATERYETMQEQADPGTLLALAADTEEVKRLVEQQAAAYEELDQIALRRRNLEAESTPISPAGRAQRDAAGALADYDEASATVARLAAEMQRVEDRAEQLQRRYDRLAAAAQAYGQDTENGFRATVLAAGTQEQLDRVFERYNATLDEASAAEDAQKAALDQLRSAQQALADATAEATRAEAQQAAQRKQQRQAEARPATTGSPSTSGSTTRAIELEQIKQQRALDQAAHVERIEQLRKETKEIESKAAIQASIDQRLIGLAAENARVDVAKAQADANASARKVEAEQLSAQRIASEQIKQAGRANAEAVKGAKRVELEAIRAGGKIAEVEITSSARITSAKLANEAKIEAARLAAAARVESTERRISAQREAREAAQAAKGKGGGLALPRTFAGFSGSGLIELAGAFGAATTAAELFQRSIQFAQEGEATARKLDEVRRNTGALLDNVDRGNRVYAEAIEFGNRYRFTNDEIAESLTALTPLIRQSNLDTEKQLEITARLAARNPSQGFDGAAFSISELANLDPVSIQDRFNLPRAAAKRVIEEVKKGVDVFVALDRELLKLGNDSSILAQRLEGPAGAQRELAKASDDLSVALAGLFTNETTNGRQWAASMVESAATALAELTKIKNFYQAGDTGERAAVIASAGAGLLDAAEYAGSKALKGNLAGGIEDYGVMAALLGMRFTNLTKDAATVDPALTKIGDSASVLGNKLAAEQLTIGQYASELAKLSQAKPADISGLLTNLADLPEPERIERLQSLLANFQNQINIKPDLAANFLPQMQAIASEIDRLKAKSPIAITVELQQRFSATATTIAGETAARVKQTTSELAQLQTQYAARRNALNQQAAANELSYQRQAARAARDFGQQQAKAARDFHQQQAKAARDFHQQEQKAEQEHARRLADIREQLSDELITIERDKAKKLRDLQGAADVERTRDREDYEKERQRLLASGEIAAAARLQDDYQTEQRRKAEDLSRAKSDTADDASGSSTEARTKADEQINQEREQYQRQRTERQAAYRQAQADAAESFRQQQAEARAAYAQQQADAAAAHAQQQAQLKAQQAAERTAYENQRGALISGLKAYLSEQKTKLEEAQKNLLEATRRNVDLSIVEQEKALERSKNSLATGLADFEATIGQAGGRASGAYMREFARRLELGADLLDPALKPTEDRLRPRSPIRRGPLKDLESAGRRAGQQYTSGLVTGIDARAIDPQLAAVRERLAQQQAADQATGAASSRQAAPVQIVIQVQPGQINLDGQHIGEALAPHISGAFERDLAAQVSTSQASSQPHRQQSAFRNLD